MYGELGGTYEEKAAELLENQDFTKPLIAFIAGKFTEDMPSKKIWSCRCNYSWRAWNSYR